MGYIQVIFFLIAVVNLQNSVAIPLSDEESLRDDDIQKSDFIEELERQEMLRQIEHDEERSSDFDSTFRNIPSMKNTFRNTNPSSHKKSQPAQRSLEFFQGSEKSDSFSTFRDDDIQQRSALEEVEMEKNQGILADAVRHEQQLQDSAIRQAASLRALDSLRQDSENGDPLRRFAVAREANIIQEKTRQDLLKEEALRQEVLRQEAVRQENLYRDDNARQEFTLRQEEAILEQIVRQEALRQDNAKRLEEAYRAEAQLQQDDPEKQEMFLREALAQENIRQESALRQSEALRQKEVVKARADALGEN